MKSKTFNIRSMTQLALLTAITLVLAYTPIGYLPLGPFNVSFLSVPVCIGAVVMGPGVGAFLGLVFGLTSFGNALSGGSVMGVALMSVSPVGYFVQSVVGRVLMGLCTGLIFRAVRKVDRRGFASYVVGAVSAPLLNTVFYMGLMCLIFYNCDYVQNLVAFFFQNLVFSYIGFSSVHNPRHIILQTLLWFVLQSSEYSANPMKSDFSTQSKEKFPYQMPELAFYSFAIYD